MSSPYKFLFKLTRYGSMVDYEMGHNFSSRDGHIFNHERGNNFHLVTVTWSKTREGTIFVTNTFFITVGGWSEFHTSTFHESCNIFCYKYIFRTVKSRVLVILRNNTSVFHPRDGTFFSRNSIPLHFTRAATFFVTNTFFVR